MPLGAPGWEGGWLALLVLWGMVRGEVTASESGAGELLGVLGQLLTFSPWLLSSGSPRFPV